MRSLLHPFIVGSVGCLFACGASTSSARIDPHAPIAGREGASSGSMSRIEEVPTALPAAYVYPIAPRTTVPVNPDDPRRVVSAQPPAAIGYGQTLHGHLQHGDTALADGSVADEYIFVGAAGDNITVDMHGGELAGQPGSHMDTYLYLVHDGRVITYNDDSNSTLDSEITTTLPAGGVYILRCTTFGSGLREGDYTITLQRTNGE